MTYQKGEKIYEGKAKRLFKVIDHDELVYQEFKDSLTALNGEKKLELAGKGKLNCEIAALILKHLNSKGIKNHFVTQVGETSHVTQKVQIIPLEVVVRNVIAGSLAKKLGKKEGEKLPEPIVDFHYKDDSLADPFINEDQAVLALKIATRAEIATLKDQALKINKIIQKMFEAAGLLLVDFKLEFGRTPQGQILLADEISPDTCRLWDLKTGEKRDKDRFRRDMGDVLESYTIVLNSLKTGKEKGEI